MYVNAIVGHFEILDTLDKPRKTRSVGSSLLYKIKRSLFPPAHGCC